MSFHLVQRCSVNCVLPFQAENWKPLPSVIFGVLGLASGSLVFLLQETRNQNLTSTVAEAENLNRFVKSASSNLTCPHALRWSDLQTAHRACGEWKFNFSVWCLRRSASSSNNIRARAIQTVRQVKSRPSIRVRLDRIFSRHDAISYEMVLYKHFHDDLKFDPIINDCLYRYDVRHAMERCKQRRRSQLITSIRAYIAPIIVPTLGIRYCSAAQVVSHLCFWVWGSCLKYTLEDDKSLVLSAWLPRREAVLLHNEVSYLCETRSFVRMHAFSRRSLL